MIVTTDEIIDLVAEFRSGRFKGLAFTLRLLPGDWIRLVEIEETVDPIFGKRTYCVFETDSRKLDGDFEPGVVTVSVSMAECYQKIPDFERGLQAALEKGAPTKQATRRSESENETAKHPDYGSW